MQERPKRNGPNLSSLIGWAIFFLVIAGGPLLRMLQGVIGTGVNLATYIPYAIAGLVLLSVIVSAVQAVARNRSRGDTVLGRDRPAPPVQPMPPFGNDIPPARLPSTPAAPRFPPPQSLRVPTPRDAPGVPRAPQFEPLFPPGVLAIGAIGLVILGAVAIVVFSIAP